MDDDIFEMYKKSKKAGLKGFDVALGYNPQRLTMKDLEQRMVDYNRYMDFINRTSDEIELD